MKVQYVVYVNDTVVKKYSYKIQAVIYCFLHGYVFTGGRYHFLHPDVRIEKIATLGDYLKQLQKVEGGYDGCN